MIATDSKLPDVGISIFSVMSQLAHDKDAINLSQGFPDFAVNLSLIEKVGQCLSQGHNQYAPMPGVPALRQSIAEKSLSLYGISRDPEHEITITSGATEALFCAITAVVHPGDEVILFEPAYDSYAPVVQLAGARPIYITLKYPDYHIDWNEVQDAINEKTRLLILNSPHNPTGAILGPEDLSALNDLAAKHRFLILSDEVYEHIVFDGARHRSLNSEPALAERSFVVSSFGKTYHATGWKLGYCLAPRSLSQEFRKIHQFVTFTSNTPMQLAYASFMENKEAYLSLPAFYQERRDFFLSLIQTSRFKPLPCRGTYFQMLSYEEISSEPDVAFAKRMTEEHGVAAIPPSVFYSQGDDHKVLRFCFAKKDDTLQRAAERLCKI